MCPGWSNRMFRGRSGDIGGDALGTFWRPIFAVWVITCKHAFVWRNVVYQESRIKEIFSKFVKNSIIKKNLSFICFLGPSVVKHGMYSIQNLLLKNNISYVVWTNIKVQYYKIWQIFVLVKGFMSPHFDMMQYIIINLNCDFIYVSELNSVW